MALVITTNAKAFEEVLEVEDVEFERYRRGVGDHHGEHHEEHHGEHHSPLTIVAKNNSKHSKDLHCIDVSTYGELEYEKKTCKKHNITLEKKFEDRNASVSILFLV